MDMSGVKVDDTVMLFNANRGDGRVGSPRTVTKVGTKLFTVQGGGVFRKETGRSNDTNGNWWVLTVEKAEQLTRHDTAIKDLRERGIELRHRPKLTLEQVEALAEVARTFDTQKDDK